MKEVRVLHDAKRRTVTLRSRNEGNGRVIVPFIFFSRLPNF